ncbi:MAG: LysR substrate-binding domain-containing protein [Gammaproteobacteria bacterium]|nr:LysR substrate-binding domain-containing protein [Gammaproteobacteria bacterium]
MKLQQIKYIFEVARNQLNVSATAEALFTSQPGISKQIRQLEDELGVEIFVRSGKHLTNITPAGREILPVAENILKQVRKIQNIAASYVSEKEGRLSFAPIPTYARYHLSGLIENFTKKYQEVSLIVNQNNSEMSNQQINRGQVDFALAYEEDDAFDGKVKVPAFYWRRALVVPKNHSLAKSGNIELANLAHFPLLINTIMSGTRNPVLEQFSANGLNPKVVCNTDDNEVIKANVRLGIGVGVVARMSYDEYIDNDLVCIDVDKLFAPTLVNLVFDQNLYIRDYMNDFIEMIVSAHGKDTITKAQKTRSAEELAQIFDLKKLPIL